MMPDGQTYERNLIESWLSQKRTSPLTGVALDQGGCELIPNRALRVSIEAWSREQGYDLAN